MDFLVKLNNLMDENQLNKNTLSKACDIPYTTIDGWYKKGYEGLKLTTLRKLSSYFGVPLDYWVNDNDRSPSQSEVKRRALARLERMSEEQARAVLAFMKFLEETRCV